MRQALSVCLASVLALPVMVVNVSADETLSSAEPSLSLARRVEVGEIPGAAVALVDDSGVFWSRGFGYENLALRTKATADTAFWLASVTKTVTAALLLHAQERGALSLDTNVSELVAKKAGFALAAASASKVSLRQLVTHTSPIRDGHYYACSYYVDGADGQPKSLASLEPWYYAGMADVPESVVKALCGAQVPSDLGTFLRGYLSVGGKYYEASNFATRSQRAVYSNVGAALAGYALELATGATIADYARTHLFDPLGMQHTSWTLDRRRLPHIATPYAWNPQRGGHVALQLYGLATNPDGGLRTSANDLGRFLSMVLRGGELGPVRVLSRAAVERMLTPLGSAAGSGTGVFWATQRDAEGRRLLGHSGSDPGATTLMQLDPEARVGFVMLSNVDSHALQHVSAAELSSELLAAARALHAARAGKAQDSAPSAKPVVNREGPAR